MKEDPNPLATLHPTARKVCRFFKSGMRLCWRGVRVAVLGLLACLLCAIVFRGSGPGSVVLIAFGGFFWLACASVALCCVFYVLRLLVTALFFMRYSLGQLMGAILIYGTCMTLIIKLPFPWKGFPIVALAFLAFFIWVYIIAHDPEDPWFTPAFVRRTLGPKQIEKDAEEPVKPADAGRTESAEQNREATH